MASRSNGASACDVLVVGGGLAATMAAISAAQSGVKVTMLVKGEVGSSGSSARAGGQIAASFGHTSTAKGEPSDDAETHIFDTLQVGCGLCSEEHVRALAEDAPAGVRELERLGVPFSKTDDGRFYQLKLLGNSRPRACSVIGGGPALMRILRKRLEALGVRLVENAAVVGLLSIDGQILGARASGMSSGQRSTVYSKATVVATGGPTGLFRSVSGDNRNTGDGLIIGYEAGAQLANLEFVEFTLIFRVRGKILAMAGLAPFLGRGCTLINRFEENFMERYYPPEILERAGRAEMLRAVVHETAEKRAPISIECSALSEPVWDEFERSQGSSILAKIREAGGNCRDEPIEVVPAAHSLLAGLVTDAKAATRIKGLWAAGECATGVHGAARLPGNGLAACLVFGRRAGRNAAHFALDSSNTAPFFDKDFPIFNEAGNSDTAPKTLDSLRSEISELAEGALGVIREPNRMLDAEKRFGEIQAQMADGADIRGSVGAAQVRHLATLGELMASAALRRKESRGLHFRSDIARSRRTWLKWLVVDKSPSGGTPEWHYRTVPNCRSNKKGKLRTRSESATTSAA